MHRHERFEEGPEWGRGRRGPRGGGWSGPPWAGPGEGPGSPDDLAGGPNRMWFYGGPFGPGAPGAQGAGDGQGLGTARARGPGGGHGAATCAAQSSLS